MKRTRIAHTTIALVALGLLFLITDQISPALALTRPQALGVGWFLHEHEDMTCTHYFAFQVSDGISKADGWYYRPAGAFMFVCSNSTAVDRSIDCVCCKGPCRKRFCVHTSLERYYSAINPGGNSAINGMLDDVTD